MEKLGTKWGLGIIPVVASCLALSAANAGGAELKWRQSQHIVKVDVIQVGDVPGHLVGAGENAGLAFFENGDVAIHSTKFTIDYTNGSGLHQCYVVVTFEDGSVFVTKGQGTTTADQEKKVASFKGAFSFIRGSGRFAGIQGEGAYTGKRFAPVPGVGAELYSDNNATYTASR